MANIANGYNSVGTNFLEKIANAQIAATVTIIISKVAVQLYSAPIMPKIEGKTKKNALKRILLVNLIEKSMFITLARSDL